MEEGEKCLFDLAFLAPFVMGKNKDLETSVNSVPVQGISSKGKESMLILIVVCMRH